MDFALPAEAELVRTSAQQLGRSLYAGMRDAERHGPSADALAGYVAAGFGRLEWPDAAGGAGLPAIYRVLVAAELAGACAGTALVLQGGDLTGAVLLALGSAEAAAAAAALPAAPSAGGRAHVFVDADARLAISGRRVAGTIPYLPDAEPAAVLVLQGRTAAWLDAGLSPAPLPPQALHAAGACELAVAGDAAWVATLDDGTYMRAMTALRLPAAAMLAGIAEASFAYAADYARQRQVFGRPIAHHQAAAFWIAELRIALDAVDVLLKHAAWAAATAAADDAPGAPAFVAATQAYVQAVETALRVTVDGVQLLGGHGYVTDHPVEKWMREARSLSLLWGGADLAQEDLADVSADDWQGVLA